jgi:hypothetical protein
MKNWLAPEGIKIPDFIICGAMKSGTTTVHAILNKHPDIFIPDKEIHFYDMDNILQHPDFNHFDEENWDFNTIDNNPSGYWQWYASKFSEANVSQLIGEDSTTYLASEIAAKRIAFQKKTTKIIVMLRQPTARAYSQYWHMVRTGRAKYTFEDTLEYEPSSLLSRSLYREQIENLYKYIPKEQVKVIVFEEFLNDKAQSLANICQFLSVDVNRLPSDALDLHENMTTYPKFLRLELIKNRLFPRLGNTRYTEHFQLEKDKSKKITFTRIFNFVFRKINPLVEVQPNKIKLSTKKFLDSFFIKELEGLNQLIDKNVYSLWFGPKE